MALRDEQADILGGPILQRPESGAFAAFSQYQFVFKSATLLGFGLLVWFACVRGLEHLKKHRELRHRKAMRRKHGIPDSDCRPFAVAYAAAKRAHHEREAQDPKKANYLSDHNSPDGDQRTDAQKDACLLRRRVPETIPPRRDYQLPGKLVSVHDNKRPEAHSLDSADLYNSHLRRQVHTPEPSPAEWRLVRRTNRKNTVVTLDNNEESRKRSFEDECDVEHETVKKSRIDGNELNGGDEQADWYAQYTSTSSRVSKESLNLQSEDSHVHTSGQEGFKRIDDLRDEDYESDEAMEGIDEDEVTELKAVARGKKRDRAEAGSTIGGDDEDDTRNARASHHRKRRTVLHRVDMPTRGQKRDREVESPESEDEGLGSETSATRSRVQRSSKKKRGKRVSDEVDELSVEDLRASRDPLCGGRRVGEDWEVDGTQYKVGENGERLRLTLVKKARNRYHMPQDSQHPDRSAALEIYVETWMTDEQYSRAEGRQELAWQEASREASGSKLDVLGSPTKNGKSLLWDSVKCSPSRRPCRQLIPPGGSMRTNPFEQWQSQPVLGRRVASSGAVVPALLPGVADSPTRPGFRGFSKWEKQDREAEAIARIRAKIEQQRKAQSSPQKPTEVPASLPTPELGAKPLSVPTITLTPAPVVASEGKPDDRPPHSKANSTFSFATTSSGTQPVKGTTTTTSTTSGSPLSSLPPPPTSTTLFPNASTTPVANYSAGTTPFSFAKPLQPSPTGAAAPPSMMPSSFGKVASATSPPSVVPLPSALGATVHPQPPTTGSTSSSVPFSFARPDVSSSTLSPLASKPQVPTSSDATSTSSGSPHPATFASILAAKAETPAPPPIPVPGTTSESTKPTPLLFSFSGATPSTTVPTPSAPSVPKFSFGQMSTTSTFAPRPNLAPGTVPQLKPTFKLGQTLSSATEGTSAVPAADESKKSATPVSTFGTAAGLNGPPKASSFGASVFGTSTFGSPSTSVTNIFGKPVTVDSSSSTSTPLKPAPMPTSTESTASATLAPAFSKPPIFSSGGSNSGSKSAEGSKPAFGDTAAVSNAVPMLGGNSEGKPTYTFGASVEGPKPMSVFGGNAETSKLSALGETPTHAPAFGGAVEAKSTFMFGGATETSGPEREGPKPFNTADPSKPTVTAGNAIFSPLSSASPFAFGKKDHVTSAPASASLGSTSTKSAAPFNFAAPLGVNGSVFGHPTSTTSRDSSQAMNSRPANAPTVFEFAKTNSSNSSSTFTFGKPTTQNQKQEQ